ncbi:YiiX/YebB-like N1pC/P60 family cysteine hydrolase [Kingella kingae]|uniref:YiiX/YebB-like N1pC/P60 family cysteine hydrolase n=1 Tax=Kingella kingae TaxID=504 RepID=UPI00041475E9|nr:YiiX/YebB-like N1pC/P60 family cysteine hydrolase [Kingella kingae]
MATGKLICKRIIQAACIIILIAGCFCYGYARFGRNTLLQVALPNPHQLQVGDWIFRSGHHADSLLIKRLSRSDFSHVGIVVQTQPTVQIAHATTDDNANLPDQVLLTPLHEFLSPKMADAVAVARPRYMSPAQRAQTAQYAQLQIGKKFVLSARGEQPFYCTLLITEAMAQQNVRFEPRWQYVDVAVFRGDYLFPQGLIESDVDWVFRAKVNPNIKSSLHFWLIQSAGCFLRPRPKRVLTQIRIGKTPI